MDSLDRLSDEWIFYEQQKQEARKGIVTDEVDVEYAEEQRQEQEVLEEAMEL